MFELLPKQVQLLNSDADIVLFGGGRGGAKTFGTSLSAALEVVELYDESEFRLRRLDPRTFRIKNDRESGHRLYYRYLIDYSYYMGVIVRRSIPQLKYNSLVETRKIYPFFGGKFHRDDYAWVFPSGARICLRPLYDDRTLDFFQGANFQRFIVEELTQFDREVIEMAQVCCRSANPVDGGVRIPSKIIYTTNPGGRGHKWVKEEIVDKCPPLPDGDPIYVEEFDLSYQPLKSNEFFLNENGERVLFIPALVFDNPHLSSYDKRYIRNLLNLNRPLRAMWLLGRWDVVAGQFFDMWEEHLHVIDEMEFYGVESVYDLSEARRKFDWRGNGYRLFLSNDYGYRNPWACGAYAVDNDLNVIKFAEIVETGLSIKQQAKLTKEHFLKYYDLHIEDFELIIADPKSYWETRDRGDEFYTFADEYLSEGIYLTKGKNERIAGAGAMVEALRLQENGLPSLRFLSCCENTISTLPHLPQDPRNHDDVDSASDDHSYDENRYFLMVVIGGPVTPISKVSDRSWRKNINTPPAGKEGKDARSFMVA